MLFREEDSHAHSQHYSYIDRDMEKLDRKQNSKTRNSKTGHEIPKHYAKHVCDEIRLVYIIATVVWLVLVFFFGLIKPDLVIIFFLLIPVIVYAINFTFLCKTTCHVEDQMFRSNFLYFAFIVAIILFSWNKSLNRDQKGNLFAIVVLALILLMISMVDIWLQVEDMPIIKHIRTTLHTASLALLALALYIFYIYYAYNTHLLSMNDQLKIPE